MPATTRDAHLRFLDHPVVQAYVSQCAFQRLTRPLQAITSEVRARTRGGANILVPCYGDFARPLAIARQLPDRSFQVVHVSPEKASALSDQAARAGLHNLTVHAADPARSAIEPRSIDVVLGLHALHHIEPLEDFWLGCAGWLRSGGVVLAQEYVGASGLQWPQGQRSAAQKALEQIVPPTLGGGMEATLNDPAELAPATAAPRASELLTTCAAAGFEITGRADASCALLVPVLLGRAARFDSSNWQHNHVLATLIREEQRLLAAGTLGVDYAMFVAEPR